MEHTHKCCDKQKVIKGFWTAEEDKKLFNYITKNGRESWSSVPRLAGIKRCGKSCRLRWLNYLRPDLKRGNFSTEEVDLILDLQKSHGNKWSHIATYLPGRSDNEIKNFWYAYLRNKSKSDYPNNHLFSFDPYLHLPNTKTFNDHVDQQQPMNDIYMEPLPFQSSSSVTQLHETHQNSNDLLDPYDLPPLPEFLTSLDSIPTCLWTSSNSLDDNDQLVSSMLNKPLVPTSEWMSSNPLDGHGKPASPMLNTSTMMSSCPPKSSLITPIHNVQHIYDTYMCRDELYPFK